MSQIEEKFEQKGLLWYFINCREAKRYKILLSYSSQALEKELDLTEYFRRMRFQSLAILTLLDWRKKVHLHRISDMVGPKSDTDPEKSVLQKRRSFKT